jgi:hypothetical protein
MIVSSTDPEILRRSAPATRIRLDAAARRAEL